MECTESSRVMRGAQEVFYEYILELHGRMCRYLAVLVGHDGECTLTQESIMREHSGWDSRVVLGEAGSVSCL